MLAYRQVEQSGAIDAVSLNSDKAIGFMIVVVVPALFWVGMLYLGTLLFGFSPSPFILTLVFLTLSAFLSVIFSAFVVGRKKL